MNKEKRKHNVVDFAVDLFERGMIPPGSSDYVKSYIFNQFRRFIFTANDFKRFQIMKRSAKIQAIANEIEKRQEKFQMEPKTRKPTKLVEKDSNSDVNHIGSAIKEKDRNNVNHIGSAIKEEDSNSDVNHIGSAIKEEDSNNDVNHIGSASKEKDSNSDLNHIVSASKEKDCISDVIHFCSSSNEKASISDVNHYGSASNERAFISDAYHFGPAIKEKAIISDVNQFVDENKETASKSDVNSSVDGNKDEVCSVNQFSDVNNDQKSNTDMRNNFGNDNQACNYYENENDEYENITNLTHSDEYDGEYDDESNSQENNDCDSYSPSSSSSSPSFSPYLIERMITDYLSYEDNIYSLHSYITNNASLNKYHRIACNLEYLMKNLKREMIRFGRCACKKQKISNLGNASNNTGVQQI